MAPGIDVNRDDLKAFLDEAEEQIQLLDEDFIRLEQEADNADLLQEIFRAAHTLKGSSGMLGFRAMAELTHHMEDLLDRVRKGQLAVTAELVDALLASLDGLKAIKGQLASTGEEGGVDIGPLVETLRAAALEQESAPPDASDRRSLEAAVASDPVASAQVEAAVGSGDRAWKVAVAFDETSAWLAVRCFQALSALSERGEVLLSVPSQQEIEQEKSGPRLEAVVLAPCDAEELEAALSTLDDLVSVEIAPWAGAGATPAGDERQAEAAAPPDGDERRVIDVGPEGRGKPQREQLELAAQKIETLQTIRIDVDQLDLMMNMVGELAIDRTRIHQISRMLLSRYKEDELVRALSDTSTHIVKVVDELHEKMMQVRMLPVGLLFGKFPRLVRDLARKMGKQITFVTEGEDTEIDRSVIEKIKDPLVHLIRNAVDHGVEPPSVRQAAGKPEAGLMKLSARHDQGYIVIALEDDGKGIDPQRIRESAVRKGMISAEAAERMTVSEAVNLIFAPGLSTVEKTTEVSGRGVGMDVVRRDIEALNGMIEVDTKPGAGARFTLRLPLTLATFRGLLVESAKTAYAIPLSYVQETVRPEPGSISTVMGQRVMNLRGSVMPLLPLSVMCRTGHKGESSGDDAFVVVVQAGDKPVAVSVDALIEQQEIVVKSLGGQMAQTRGIAGASILGDGQVVLILDVPVLIKAAMQREALALAS